MVYRVWDITNPELRDQTHVTVCCHIPPLLWTGNWQCNKTWLNSRFMGTLIDHKQRIADVHVAYPGSCWDRAGLRLDMSCIQRRLVYLCYHSHSCVDVYVTEINLNVRLYIMLHLIHIIPKGVLDLSNNMKSALNNAVHETSSLSCYIARNVFTVWLMNPSVCAIRTSWTSQAVTGVYGFQLVLGRWNGQSCWNSLPPTETRTWEINIVSGMPADVLATRWGQRPGINIHAI